MGESIPLKRWKTGAFAALALLLILSAAIYPQLELPPPSGSYPVGRALWRWVDASRPEVLTEDPDDMRGVITMVWYPAEAGTGSVAGYFPHLSAVAGELVQSGEVEGWQVLGLRFIRSKSRLDATPVRAGSRFPVLIFSPGNATNIEFYSSLASEIASHGYIVVGINHPYDVPAVRLLNGEVALYDKDQWALTPQEHQKYSAERIKVRVADVLYVLNQLEELNSTGPFAGTMDLNSVGVAGHSLGGITASEACKADGRFKACVNLDGLQKGGPFSMVETAVPPEQPFLFLTKEAQLHPDLREVFESMQERYWVVIHGASHQSFTDELLLQPSLVPGPNRAEKFMRLIQKYSLAFLDHTLKDQPSGLLSQAAHGGKPSMDVFPSN